jgi:hypothetical protein
VSDLVHDEQQVPDVQGDVPADFGVEGNVGHRSFPYAVEVDADEVAVGVDDRASGVAAGGMVRRKEQTGWSSWPPSA